MHNFDPYSVCLAIATNIPVLRMTGFIVQGHIYKKYLPLDALFITMSMAVTANMAFIFK